MLLQKATLTDTSTVRTVSSGLWHPLVGGSLLYLKTSIFHKEGMFPVLVEIFYTSVSYTTMTQAPNTHKYPQNTQNIDDFATFGF